MKHTRPVEAHAEDMLERMHLRGQLDYMTTIARTWANEGGVTMTDEQLKGALTGLQYAALRATQYDMPVSIYHLIGDAAGVMVSVNRTRALSPEEEAEIRALIDGSTAKVPVAPIEIDPTLHTLIQEARTACAQDDLVRVDALLSAIERRVQVVGAEVHRAA